MNALHPTTIYLDEELRNRIALLSMTTKRPKAEIIRQLMHEGFKTLKSHKSRSAAALGNLKGIIKEGLPADISEKHDQYTWE